MKILKFFFFFLLVAASGCSPKKFMLDGDPPPLSPVQMPEKIKIALVLGSGGVRGMAHVGVLEEFENAGIKFDVMVGCSAGSLVAALYADHPHSPCIKYAVETMRTDTLLDINFWDCRFGLSQGRALRRMLHETLEARTFEELKIPLVVVATDLWTGELVPLGSGELIKAVQASCAIPLVFAPIELHGRILLDGGIIDPVPVSIAKDLGADIVIAVDLCEILPTTFPTNLFGIAKRSAEIAFIWQTKACTHGADIVIRPKTCDVGMFNDKMMTHLYEAGKIAAREAIPRIKELIATCPEYPSNDAARSRMVQLSCYHAEHR